MTLYLPGYIVVLTNVFWELFVVINIYMIIKKKFYSVKIGSGTVSGMNELCQENLSGSPYANLDTAMSVPLQ